MRALRFGGTVVAKITISGLSEGSVKVDSMKKAIDLVQSEEFFRANPAG